MGNTTTPRGYRSTRVKREAVLSAPAKTPDETMATIVPYRNPCALFAYYTGIFSFIPLLGLLLAPAAFVLGAMGLRRRLRDSGAHGLAHALIGLFAGGFFTLVHWGLLFFMACQWT
jgi:hypothetical protein